MHEIFEEVFEEARDCLDRGEPFWCDDFTRPTDQKFAQYLIAKGFNIYYLYFIESWEGVYSPQSYLPEDLRKISLRRFALREFGVEESALPTSL